MMYCVTGLLSKARLKNIKLANPLWKWSQYVINATMRDIKLLYTRSEEAV